MKEYLLYIIDSDIVSSSREILEKFIRELRKLTIYVNTEGDQVTVKLVYSVEANEELKKFKDSNGQFITLNGINGRKADKEAIQAMYNLTLVLPDTKLTDPEF